MNGSPITNPDHGNGPSVADRPWVGTLIILQGFVTIALVFAYFPVGVFAVVVNVVAAVTSRGAHRKLFASFAIVGALLCLIIGITLFAVSYSGTAQVTKVSTTP